MFLGLGFLAYGSTLGNFFLSDDFVFLHQGWERGWGTLITDPPNRFFRPAFGVLLGFDQIVFGLGSSGMHVVAIVLNALSAVGVSWFTLLFLEWTSEEERTRSQGQATAVAAGLFFLLNPSHAEAVNWLSAMPDVLATTFALFCWVSWLAYRRRGDSRWLLACLLSWFLSLLSKEVAIAVPAVILILEAGRSPTSLRRGSSGRAFVLFSFVFVLYLLLRRAALGVWVGGYGTAVHLNLDALEALKNLAVFVFRSFSPPVAFSRNDLLTTLLLLGAGIAPFAYYFRRVWFPPPREFWVAGFCLLLAAAPAANLGLAMEEPDGDRFLYLGTVFSGVLLAMALSQLCQRPQILYPATLLVALLYGGALVSENHRWNRAAQLAEQIIDDVAAISPREELWIYELPDRYGGAYVFRNGFEEALALYLSGPQFAGVHRNEMRNYGDDGTVLGQPSPYLLRGGSAGRGAFRFDRGRISAVAIGPGTGSGN